MSHQIKTGHFVEHDFGLFVGVFTDVKTSMSQLVPLSGRI